METAFNVIIENNGRFEPYNIMIYLKDRWVNFVKRYNEFIKDPDFDVNDSYWKYPKTFEEFKVWVDNHLKYQYWSRCEYELVLSSWPSYELDEDTDKYQKGTLVIPNGKGKKIDIYEQCKMNLDIITRIFMENVGI